MQAQTSVAPPATHPFRDALMARDWEGVREALNPDVVLNSPILSTPFEGREAVVELFEVIRDTLEDIDFTVDMADGDVRFMSWRTHIGDVRMEGAEIMRLDDEGRIKEFTVFFRPLAGVTVLASALGKGLAGRRSPARGRIAAAASQPMVLLSRVTDRVAPRLVK
jgi:ketosteroid isomerase-like protein